MPVGEIFLAAFIGILFTRLTSPEFLNFMHREGLSEKMNKWRKLLETIQAVLNDAEEKELTDKAVKLWLDDLKDLAYDAEDVLDEFTAEAFASGEHSSSTSKARKLVSAALRKGSPFSFYYNEKMRTKVRRITARLQETCQRITELGLTETSGNTSMKSWKPLPSTGLQDRSNIYGRGKDKREVLEHVLEVEPVDDVNFQVIPIVGMAGIGKTCLAKCVYNDEAVKHFEIRAWVYVSMDSDIVRVTKSILESITLQVCQLKELHSVQSKLVEALAGRRFLIVLDDFWNNNYAFWEALQSPFTVGAPGSKILVTTRLEEVALTVGTTKSHKLKPISDDACWSVFGRHAFGNRDMDALPNPESFRDKVVTRCKGLPLAAKTLGGILRSKQTKDEWEQLLSSKIWDLPADRSDILPVLRLSYYHLPSHLKRCFAYCAILPKEYDFEEMELVLLWVAEGLIEEPQGSRQRKELGRTYFHELRSRSIFEESNVDESRFGMHDLINDLAEWAAGDTCVKFDEQSFGIPPSALDKARHSSYIRGYLDGTNKFETFYKLKCLRTFLPMGSRKESYLAITVLHHLLPSLKCLRVLSLQGYMIRELPDSIGGLIHLRYLNLSYSKIIYLPESICSLHNLQILILKGCKSLERLPFKLGNLINLCHLDLRNAYKIEHLYESEKLPLGMDKLKILPMLSNFVVERGIRWVIKRRSSLVEMKLKRSVTGVEVDRAASILDKMDIDALSLLCREPDSSIGMFDELEGKIPQRLMLEKLKPVGKAKNVKISDYIGKKFPGWLGNPFFSKVVCLRLENCWRCTLLPPFGLLHSLKSLWMIGMIQIESIGSEFYGEHNSKPFPSLETLHFENMRNWKNWIHNHEVDYQNFPRLRELCVRNCNSLSGKLPSYLPSAERIQINGCSSLVVSIHSMPKLEQLELQYCKELIQEGVLNLNSVKYIILLNISKLRQLRKDFLRKLSSLESFIISGCRQLISLMAEEQEQSEGLPQRFYSFMNLKELVIEHCPQLISFANVIFPSLKAIRIRNCDNIASSVGSFISRSWCLEEMKIESCDSLMSFQGHHLPPTLKRIEISYCRNLKTLLGMGDCSASSTMHGEVEDYGRSNYNVTTLELYIHNCESLTSLIIGDVLPGAIKNLKVNFCPELTTLSLGDNLQAQIQHLHIANCSKLESVGGRVDGVCLETIEIFRCDNLKSISDFLDKSIHLKEVTISNCPSLISLQLGDESSNTNLKKLQITTCKQLEALPNVHNLKSLQELVIVDCPGIASFPEEGFPTNLIELHLSRIYICQPLFEWGLHKLSSLQELNIRGGYRNMVSFPQDETRMVLPKSLIRLTIGDFPDLKYLSNKGFQSLVSLEHLEVTACPKLASFPKNGLPTSVMQLVICDCPLLENICKRGEGKEWFKISHIPCIVVDGFEIDLRIGGNG